MKTLICILPILISIETNGFSESTSRNLHMPSIGYWVVETNPQKCDLSLVYYYDNNDDLIHSEVIVLGPKNFPNNRLKRKLNKKLKHFILKESSDNTTESDNQWVLATKKK